MTPLNDRISGIHGGSSTHAAALLELLELLVLMKMGSLFEPGMADA